MIHVEFVNDLRFDDVDHMLVFAEAGFSMLDHFARGTIGLDGVAAFVETVNHRDEVGTLWPRLALSAVPRRAIRDSVDPSLVERFVVEFLEGLETHDLPRKRVGIHFATPHLSAHALEGIKAATTRFQARGPRSHDGTHTVVIARGV